MLARNEGHGFSQAREPRPAVLADGDVLREAPPRSVADVFLTDLGPVSQSQGMNLLVPVALGVVLGCGSALKKIEPLPNTGQFEDRFAPGDINRNLDLLIVIDRAPSMGPNQRRLLCGLPQLVDRLKRISLDLHIAVVSSEMGAGATGTASAPQARGDDGAFHWGARPETFDCALYGGSGSLDTSSCTGPTDGRGFIRYRSETDNNIGNQDLPTALACISNLGTTGCELTSPSRRETRARTVPIDRAGSECRVSPGRRLLANHPPDGRGRLLGATGLPPVRLEHGHGPWQPTRPVSMSFRCAEFGRPAMARDHPGWRRRTGQGSAPNDELASTDALHALVPVSQLVAEIGRIKPLAQISVEALAGPWTGGLSVRMTTQQGGPVPSLAPACSGEGGDALPAVRIPDLSRCCRIWKKSEIGLRRIFLARYSNASSTAGRSLIVCLGV